MLVVLPEGLGGGASPANQVKTDPLVATNQYSFEKSSSPGTLLKLSLSLFFFFLTKGYIFIVKNQKIQIQNKTMSNEY